MNIKNKSILITGSKRVGQSVAKRLANSGANIAVHYNSSAEQANALVGELQNSGVKSFAVKANVSSKPEVDAMIARVVEEFGSLDVLITMASIFNRTPFNEITEADWDKQMSVNLKGTWLCAKAAADVMLKQGHGKIITFADWAALKPYKNYLPYLVAKGGIVTMTKALAVELAPAIQVNGIMPGPVLLPDDYDEAAAKRIADATLLKRVGSPDDIAETVAFLIEGTDFMTGAMIPVEGGRLLK